MPAVYACNVDNDAIKELQAEVKELKELTKEQQSDIEELKSFSNRSMSTFSIKYMFKCLNYSNVSIVWKL